MFGRKNCCGLTRRLSCLKSRQTLMPPSFFFTQTVGEFHGDVDGRAIPSRTHCLPCSVTTSVCRRECRCCFVYTGSASPVSMCTGGCTARGGVVLLGNIPS